MMLMSLKALIISSAIALTSLFALTACNEGPVEQAGETVDQAIEDTGDAVENAGDAVEEATN